MVSDDFQKWDRSWDDKLPQPSTHAVTSQRQKIYFYCRKFLFFSLALECQKCQLYKAADQLVQQPDYPEVCSLSHLYTELPQPFPLFSTSTSLPCWHPLCEEQRAPGTFIQDPEKQSGPGYWDANPRRCGVFNLMCGALVVTMSEILGGLPVCSVPDVVLGQAVAEEEKLSYPVCSPSLLFSASPFNTILVSQSQSDLLK